MFELHGRPTAKAEKIIVSPVEMDPSLTKVRLHEHSGVNPFDGIFVHQVPRFGGHQRGSTFWHLDMQTRVGEAKNL